VTVLLGLTAACCWAFVNLRLASLSGRVDSAAMMLVLMASSIVLTAPLAVAFEGAPGHDARAGIPAAALAGLLEVTGFICYLRAVRVGSMAVVAPLIGLEGGVAALIAVAGGESAGGLLALGLVAAVIGSSLACAAPGERRASGAGWAIAAGIQFGVIFVLYGAAAPLGAWSIVTVARLSAVVLLAPWVIGRHIELPHGRTLAWLVTAGVLDSVAFGAFAVAAARGPVSVASVCAAQFSTISVIFAVIVLRERPAPVQMAGIVLTLIGTTLLAAT
jgi:drug/metabolite transporter (DMT)-like permease